MPTPEILASVKQTRDSGVNHMDHVKRSRKSKIKKRPDDWEQLKVEIAKEIGLWPKVASDGWAGLSAAESGRLGGVFSTRKKALAEAAAGEKENNEEIRG